MQTILSRRIFLAGASLAAVAGLAGRRESIASESAPETTIIRLARITGICIAPQYVAEALLHLEGFTNVSYVNTEVGYGQSEKIARGEVDFSLNFAAPLALAIDATEPIVILAGVHPGCFELFGNE